MEASKDSVSYKSPLYAELDADVEKRLGLPPGLQAAIRTRGERSNADQVSEAGAKTVYQIIEPTRDAALKKWGIDAYVSPENAAEVAGLLLKDSLQRNAGDVAKAVAEYHGGTNPKNHGPITAAYVRRVTGKSLVPEAKAAEAPSIGKTFAAYQAGTLTPEQSAAFESDVAAGKVLLPPGASMKGAPRSADQAPTNKAPSAGTGVIAAYAHNQMTPDERAEFEDDARAGRIQVPEGIVGPAPSTMDKIKAVPGAVAEAVTGKKRETEQTRTLPDWVAMPELNTMSRDSFYASLGTLFAGPDEAVKIIKAQFPDTKIRKDEKGNYLLKSGIDGQEYAIKPGFTWGDIPRAVAAVAAFTPAGKAATIPGAAIAGAATQGAIEATQAATGGEFNPNEVALAAGGAAAVPAAGRVISAVRAAHAPVPPAPNPAAAIVEGATPPGAMQQAEARAAAGVPAPVQPVAAPAATPARVAEGVTPASALPEGTPGTAPGAGAATRPAEVLTPASVPVEPVAPGMTLPPAAPNPGPAVVQSAEELAQTARAASQGSKKATATLAEQAAPDAETVAAAKRLGVEDHLQPDHVTTNQAYRELAQAVKSVPGSATRTAEMEGLENVAKRADAVITELGGTQDLSAVSAAVKTRLQEIHTQLKAGAKKLYDEIDAAIAPTTPAPATDVLALVSKRAEEMGGLKNLSAAERDLFAKLSPAADGTQPTYALLDQVRKDIGAAKRGTDNVFKTADGALLGRIERALQVDQGRIAAAAGVANQWGAARSIVTMYKGVQDDLTALFGKTLQGSIVGDMSGATTALAKGDNSRFIKLLQSVPPEMRQEVTASGLASAFAHQSRGGGISFPGYVKWFEGLEKNTQARNALFSNLPPEAVQRLRDLYTVSKGIAASSRERITTGRIMAAPIKEILENGDSLMEKIYGVARRSAGGLAAEAITAPLGIPGAGIAAGIASALARGKPSAMKAADALINSPEFRTAVRAGTKTNVSRLAHSGKFTAFVRAAGNPREMTTREKWIAQSLQGKKDGKK